MPAASLAPELERLNADPVETAAFWRVAGLRELPKEKWLPIGKIGTIKDGWREDAPPRGPELVALPESLSYEE